MWQALLGPVLEIGKSWIKGKAEEQKVKQKVKLEKLRTDSDWEARMADATRNSWKDEWFSLILSAPLIAVAWSVASDNDTIIARVNLAFEALSALPEWYQYLLFIAVSASFGLKSADKIMGMRKK